VLIDGLIRPSKVNAETSKTSFQRFDHDMVVAQRWSTFGPRTNRPESRYEPGRSRRAPACRVWLGLAASVVCFRWSRHTHILSQHATDRRDPERRAVGVDELARHGRRESTRRGWSGKGRRRRRATCAAHSPNGLLASPTRAGPVDLPCTITVIPGLGLLVFGLSRAAGHGRTDVWNVLPAGGGRAEPRGVGLIEANRFFTADSSAGVRRPQLWRRATLGAKGIRPV
jgi:hypothetical protein